MSSSQELHISFRHLDTDYDINLMKGEKSDYSVEINGVSYAVLGEKGKLETACKILNSVSLDSISDAEDLKEKLSVCKDISFPQAKLTHDIGIQTLNITTAIPSTKISSETDHEIKIPEIMPHTFAGDRPLGIYQSVDKSRSIQFLEKDGHLFEIGIGHPEKPTECLLLKDGSFQLKDLPLTLKYDRYADSITVEENEKVVHTLKPGPLNIGETVDKLCRSLENYYIFPEIGKECSDYLKKQLNEGAYESLKDPEKLRDALTSDLYEKSKDKHLCVYLPGDSFPPSINQYSLPDLRNPSDGYKSKLNNSSIPYEIKTGFIDEDSQVGYVDLRALENTKYIGPKPKEGGEGYEDMIDFEARRQALIKAIDHIKTAKTVIIDLRNNGGGHINGVQFISSLFLDKELDLSRIEWREGDSRKTVPVKSLSYEELSKDHRLLEQKIMILIGPDTFSGGEAFANDLQVLSRATLIGEPSKGGANPVRQDFIIGGFEVAIPEGEAVNPIQKAKGERNWEGKGVTPDIPASDALNKAIALCSAKS